MLYRRAESCASPQLYEVTQLTGISNARVCLNPPNTNSDLTSTFTSFNLYSEDFGREKLQIQKLWREDPRSKIQPSPLRRYPYTNSIPLVPILVWTNGCDCQCSRHRFSQFRPILRPEHPDSSTFFGSYHNQCGDVALLVCWNPKDQIDAKMVDSGFVLGSKLRSVSVVGTCCGWIEFHNENTFFFQLASSWRNPIVASPSDAPKTY